MSKTEALKMADDLDTLCDPYDSAIAAELRRLVTENEALQADSGRYRYIRDHDKSDRAHLRMVDSVKTCGGAFLDEEIDQQRREGA